MPPPEALSPYALLLVIIGDYTVNYIMTFSLNNKIYLKSQKKKKRCNQMLAGTTVNSTQSLLRSTSEFTHMAFDPHCLLSPDTTSFSCGLLHRVIHNTAACFPWERAERERKRKTDTERQRDREIRHPRWKPILLTYLGSDILSFLLYSIH